ncbi:MAG: hypothetical protein LBE31_11930 [Deltaproteobacteria bacterium]|jgi:hypothetical protein|nr:hypothetical protein [Deltaproteobacteria bacterium]
MLNKFSSIFLLIIAVFSLWPGAVKAAVDASDGRPQIFLYLLADNPQKEADGQVTQDVVLKVNSETNNPKFQSVDIYYSFSEVFGPAQPQATWYWAALDPNQTRLKLSSGSLVKAQIKARASLDGRFYYAMGEILIYGRGQNQSSGPGQKSEEPLWPSLKLANTSIVLRTGDELLLKTGDQLKPDGKPRPKTLWLRDDSLKKWAEITSADGYLYHYQIDLDKKLSSQGYAATKPIYLIEPLDDGGASSLTIWVYRSQTHGRSQPLGLAVIFAFMVGSFFLFPRFLALKPAK